jgi:hypothetical protein
MKITPLALPPSAADAAEPRPAPAASPLQPAMTRLAGPTLAQRGPDLARGADPSAREMSGWAMAGSGVSE